MYHSLLPADIQREIAKLLKEHKEIKKVSPKFYDNPDDVYWKEMVSTVTDEKVPEGTSWRDFYESFIYEKHMAKRPWLPELLTKMCNDEIFISRHINIVDYSGMTALIFASRYTWTKEVVTLVKAGADLNIQDQYSSTALLHAIGQRETEILSILLSYKPDVNLQNSVGKTALMIAAYTGNIKGVQLLLEAGALINIQDIDGYTALMFAAIYSKIEIIKMLLAKGADVNIGNKRGVTAINLARPELGYLFTNS
jgi:ankyrin repeat protein